MKSLAPKHEIVNNILDIENRTNNIVSGLPARDSSQSPQELFWFARTVKNRQNGEYSIFDGEVNVVTGKAAQTNLTRLLANFWESFRIGLRTLQSTIYIQNELFSQTWPVLFIPS